MPSLRAAARRGLVSMGLSGGLVSRLAFGSSWATVWRKAWRATWDGAWRFCQRNSGVGRRWPRGLAVWLALHQSALDIVTGPLSRPVVADGLVLGAGLDGPHTGLDAAIILRQPRR